MLLRFAAICLASFSFSTVFHYLVKDPLISFGTGAVSVFIAFLIICYLEGDDNIKNQILTVAGCVFSVLGGIVAWAL